ncbi:hypothetical protein RchiOBHm_Chr7g0212371 [Rosa chinensis]|uniref:Uncharacterized protein n=1 Tax=Rosa chinensis TaxID=74649 RepID=A0A2P6PAR4_ROSCH|nr:hypothetical protein RchiOBHm_Chr7g0212371 [Rosa chinensis]
MRASATALLLVLLILIFVASSSSIPIHSSSAKAMEEGSAGNEENRGTMKELHGNTWQGKKTWMNHGSFRSPRKHLVKYPTELPFQAQELSV